MKVKIKRASEILGILAIPNVLYSNEIIVFLAKNYGKKRVYQSYYNINVTGDDAFYIIDSIEIPAIFTRSGKQ